MNVDLTVARVRELRPDDAESVARYINDREVWCNLRDRVPHPYSVIDAERFIASRDGVDPQTHFAIDVDGQAIGACGADRKQDVHQRTVEIGFWVGRPYWGRGIASEVVPWLTRWVFATFEPLRVEAQVFGFNPASARVLEKAGFVREATLRDAVTKAGETTDLWIYARFPDDRG